jgi:hypothetical protein
MELIHELNGMDLNDPLNVHERKILTAIAKSHAFGHDEVPLSIVALFACFRSVEEDTFVEALSALVNNGFVLRCDSGDQCMARLSASGMRQVSA